MEKKGKKSIFDNKRVTLVAALLIAFLIWVIVAGFIMPNETLDMPDVPINYEYNIDQLAERGLQIAVEPAETTVDVRVRGDGAQLGYVVTSSVRAYADYSNVTEPGIQEVPIRVDRVSSDDFIIDHFTVNSAGYTLDSVSQKRSITLNIEEIESRRFSITPVATGVVPAAGYMQDAISCEPRIVDIRGSKSNIDRIARVAAVVAESEQREESAHYTGVPIVLYDEFDNELNAEELGLTLSIDVADVNITILEIRTIGLAVDFGGMPNYLDSDWFYERITLSADEVQVVGSADTFASLDNPMTVAYFDLSQLGLNWTSEPQNVDLTDYGVRSYDELKYITVEFNTAGLIERTFEVPTRNLRIVNRPQNLDIEPLSDEISVMLIGLEDEINSLTAENIILQLDAFGVQASGGAQQPLAVRVLAPLATHSFAVGTYNLICDVGAAG